MFSARLKTGMYIDKKGDFAQEKGRINRPLC